MSRTAIQLITFAGNVALARLVSPANFGLAALVLVISSFALVISDLGLGAALIHVQELTQRRIDTVFWLNALAGVILTVALLVLAYPLSHFFRKPELAGLFMVASITYTIALTIVPLALLERGMNLKPAAISEVVATIFGLGVALTAAVLGAGGYAVVLNPLATTAGLTVCYAIATRYRPRGFITRADASAVWTYSRGLVGFNIVNYFTRNSDDLLLGRFASPVSLGYYSRAFLLMLLPVQQIQFIIGRVLFPVLSRMRGDLSALRTAHRKSLVLSSAICAPLAAGLAVCSHDFVVAFFGSRWAPMAPMVAILSSTGVQQVFQGTVGTLYQVVGRNDVMFRWNILFTALTLTAFAIGIQWGAIGMCWAVSIRGWALLPLTLHVPLRLIGERIGGVARALLPVCGALVLEAACVLSVRFAIVGWVASPAVRLVVEVVFGAGAYLAALRVLDAGTFRELRRMLLGRLGTPGAHAYVGRR